MTNEIYSESWREQGRPKCDKCRKPVLYGFTHNCKKNKVVRTAKPAEYPL